MSSIRMEASTATTEQLEVQINKRIKTDHQSTQSDDDLFDDDLDIQEIDLSAIMASRKPANQNLSVSFEHAPVEGLGDLLNTTESSPKPPINSQSKRKKFTRYLVANVRYSAYEIRESQFTEKVLTLVQEEANCAVTARLRQEWEHTTVAIGDVVHVPYTDTMENDIVIDNHQNFIVVHPDKLISCTAVADSFACIRKSVLQMKIRGASEYSEALVHGNIIHAVLQEALITRDFSLKSIRKNISNTIKNSVEALYAIDQDEQTASTILTTYADSIHQFGMLYVNDHPKPNAKVSKDMGANVEKELGCTSVAICKILDIEEHLWSPTFGLKGMIDASVQLKLSPSNKVLTIPFELKTGKTSRFLTNRAQTLLYTLLMSDRYDIDVRAGVLYYSKTNSLYLVPALQNDLQSLVMARNHLAVAERKSSIPPMIKDMHTCQYCYLNHACTIYHKSIELGTSKTSELHDLFDKMTGHLNDSTTEFVRHWWNLLDQEETDIDYVRKDIWSQPAEIREMMGQCLSNMKLDVNASQIDSQASRWRYCFVRTPQQPLVCNISVGDPVVVSSMEGHINLAMGFVTKISLSDIHLTLNEPLRIPPQMDLGFDAEHNQNFYSFVGVQDNLAEFYNRSKVLYRIDKDEMSTGMSLLRNNLIMLVARTNKDDCSGERLRELIIGMKKPEFSTAAPHISATSKMNPDQRNALRRVLQAKDYSLILGMPGTGKTTTTAEIISYLVQMNKSVLVSAYTHTALDNVLVKVREQGVDVLRLGNIDKVMPSMRDCVPSVNSTITSVHEMQEYYKSKRVVGVTCLGIGDIMLQKRQFDYCIIDEASQITLPTCIGPLRYADRFVLVGDLYQLPPIIRNKEAKDGGLDKSLFATLAEARPESICYLEHQYRMCKEIMDVSNLLIYDGKLKCGSHAVAQKQLSLPNIKTGLQEMHQSTSCAGLSSCWLKSVVDPNRKVIFVDTDKLQVKESRPFGSYVQNDTEATLIEHTAEALLNCGLKQDQLAIISVYRSQLRLISQLLKKRPKIEIATIDKYQGRDKECVILSLVRSNTQGNTGDLLRDWRRLNVAITRAKSKLILFGSLSTLKSSALYSHLIDMFEQKEWIYHLAFGSETMHLVEEEENERQIPKDKKTHKTFSPTTKILKENQILKELHQFAS